jgi:hypothetical protein
MRLRRPAAPNRSCAAPMSITASGAPPARSRVPATVTARSASALCSCSDGRASAGNPPGASVAIAAGFRNTVAGASSASRSAPAAGRGIRAGAMAGHRQRIHAHHAHRQALAVRAGGVGGELQHRAGQHHLRMGGHAGEQGLVERALHAAQLQVGLAVDGAHRAGKLAQRRGVDQVHRNASATPSITATTAAALRQGWWRSSCQEKVRNRASMQALCRWRRHGAKQGCLTCRKVFVRRALEIAGRDPHILLNGPDLTTSGRIGPAFNPLKRSTP